MSPKSIAFLASSGRLLAALFVAILSSAPASRAQDLPKIDSTPRLGILVPINPPDYRILLDALIDAKSVTDGPFTYRTGAISGVPIVLIIQSSTGDLMRALGAQEMIRAFNVRALIYPGTSGGHLAKGRMGIGDIVLGAENVDHANYHLGPDGTINPGTFNSTHPGSKNYGPLYADPRLLAMLAHSARRVADATDLPGWVDPADKFGHPQVFYFGIQGTSTIWSDNREYIQETMKVFHEIDEDGDWDSALVATIYHVPFIEVSVISNSIFVFPSRSHGTPTTPPGEPNSHVLAQRISNRVALDLIAHFGQRILLGTYTEPTTSPFPAENFETPTNPRELLTGSD